MKKREVTIKDLAEILLPKLWLIILVSVIASCLSFAYSRFFKDDTYTVSSTLMVNSTISTSGSITTGDNIIVARYMLENYKIVLKSDNFLNRVVKDLSNNKLYEQHRDLTQNLNAKQIKSMLTISHYEDTEIFSLSVTAGDPQLAAVVLNAIHDNAITGLAGVVESAKIFKLSALQDPISPESAKLIAKNSKHEFRNAILAFLVVGVLLAVAVWVYSFFDVIIRDKKNLSDNIDIPILGVIPKHELILVNKGDDANV